ncbi:MAG: N-acetylneuraminate synthase family protein [Phycisphaerales bacterium]
MRIGEREIGVGLVYVIAEIGVNHDGSVGRACELIDACADAGADAVKFQSFTARELMSAACELAGYQKDAGESDAMAMLERLQLNAHELAECVERAHEREIHAIVTPFTLHDLELMKPLAWDAFKTASPDLINKPLLDAIAGDGRPMIVSTGASTLDEVERAIGWLGHAHDRLAFLQCVSSYPADGPNACLAGIGEIARRSRSPVGYSDHTPEVHTGAIAVGAGALLLEKHVTHDTGATGPDHGASLDPNDFREYARLAREAAGMMGCGKAVREIENDVRRVSRQSVVSRTAIAKGAALTRDMLAIKRPGTGIEPWRIESLVGRTASRDIAADVPIVEDDLS